MQLVLSRSQKATGLMSKTITFCLDARVAITREERANIDKYKLGSQVVYNSSTTKQHLDKVMETAGGGRGILSGAVHLAMSKMSLSITVDSLTKGHHIECKDLDELLGAEEAIETACQNIITYVDMAATFDGREIVIDLPKKLATA